MPLKEEGKKLEKDSTPQPAKNSKLEEPSPKPTQKPKTPAAPV